MIAIEPKRATWIKRSAAVCLGALLSFAGLARASEAPKLVAAGEWSKAVVDKDGYALRGRIVLCERMQTVGGRAHFEKQSQREVATYVELQDASEMVGRSMRLYCDFGKSDFRPENKSGLQFEMLDADKHAVPSAAFAFGGGVPQSMWVTLPGDATIRLRTSPFGVSREKGLAIVADIGHFWVIEENDAKEYFLSGTFTIDPPKDDAPAVDFKKRVEAEHIWRGTIALPAVGISIRALSATSQATPATTQAATTAPDAIATLVASLMATHGLWINGAAPILDLPADATDDQVLTKVFKMITPPAGKITSFKILEKRKVEIPTVRGQKIREDEIYQAVELETNIGPKIVLLQRGRRGGCWSRIYDAEHAQR